MAFRATLLFLAAVLAATSSHAQVSQAQPDPKVFAAVQEVGDLVSPCTSCKSTFADQVQPLL